MFVIVAGRQRFLGERRRRCIRIGTLTLQRRRHGLEIAGRRTVRAGKRCEKVIETAVLLYDDDDALDRRSTGRIAMKTAALRSRRLASLRRRKLRGPRSTVSKQAAHEKRAWAGMFSGWKRPAFAEPASDEESARSSRNGRFNYHCGTRGLQPGDDDGS